MTNENLRRILYKLGPLPTEKQVDYIQILIEEAVQAEQKRIFAALLNKMKEIASFE